MKRPSLSMPAPKESLVALGDLTSHQLWNLAIDWTENINDAPNEPARQAAEYEFNVLMDAYKAKKAIEDVR